MKKWIVMLCLLPSFAFAQETICSKTYRSIKVGSSMQEVLSNCGKPISKKEGLRNVIESEDVVQWIYSSNPDNVAASQRPSLMFTLKDRKIIGVSIAGQSVQSTNLCNSKRTIGIGADDLELQQACGAPNFTNKSTNERLKGFIKYQEWVIDQGAYQPKLIIQFERNKVTSIQSR